jgi:hypothetical protein
MRGNAAGAASVRWLRVARLMAWTGMLAATACHSRSASTEPQTIEVRADRGWQETGVVVDGRTPFTLRDVSGEIRDEDTNIRGGAGSDYVCGKADCCEPMPHVRRSALIARVGDDVFDVSNGGRFTRRAKGPLFLRINDCDAGLRDNSGALTVKFVPDTGLATGY